MESNNLPQRDNVPLCSSCTEVAFSTMRLTVSEKQARSLPEECRNQRIMAYYYSQFMWVFWSFLDGVFLGEDVDVSKYWAIMYSRRDKPQMDSQGLFQSLLKMCLLYMNF